MYKRQIAQRLIARLAEPRRFIQIVVGARQVGKTTAAGQALQEAGIPSLMVSGDDPSTKGGSAWIETQWERARRLAKAHSGGSLLVIDEAQKVPNWSETVKRLWDEDCATGVDLKLLLLGSSQLLLQKGLTESLTGRFELLRVSHWQWPEIRQAFDVTLDQFIFFGGYPGAMPLLSDEERWRAYIADSIIDAAISRDILQLSPVLKPALLRSLFTLGCAYSGQVLSYTKIVGQLQDAGNTTTLAHYLTLLEGAGLLGGIEKYSPEIVRRRASSPKFQVFNNALMSACLGVTYGGAIADPQLWGRLVESAVGTHLLAGKHEGAYEVGYWRERDDEVDFVLRKGERLVAIEIKSGAWAKPHHGLEAFGSRYGDCACLLIGPHGMPLDEFLSVPPAELFQPA